MQAKSDIVKIKNNNNPSVEYIESEMVKLGIKPLRWAVTEVSKDFYTISVTKII